MNVASSIGTWLSIGSPVIAELASLVGFDWALIDLEHGNATEASVAEQLRALGGNRTKGIVRVGAPHADLIARVLDWGAAGIMAPHVNSAGEAEHVVRAAYYPPRGRRGYSRTVRAYQYGLCSPDEAPAPIVMTQIETIEGVRHVGEIARVEGVDVLFVGPADLQFDLRRNAATAPRDYAWCLEQVVAAANEVGKEAGILLRSLADVSYYLDLGFTRVAIDSDVAILRNAWQQTLSKIRDTKQIPHHALVAPDH